MIDNTKINLGGFTTGINPKISLKIKKRGWWTKMIKDLKNWLWLVLLAIFGFLFIRKKRIKDTSFKSIEGLYKKAMPKAYLYLVDSDYYIPTIKEVREFLAEDKTDLIKYLKNLLDCDDFAIILAGASRLKSNFRLGIATSQVHAYNTIPVINDDGVMEVILIEPQNDQVFTVKEAEQGSEAFHTVFVWL